ncbi:MAG: hypothetical protein GY952_08330 [Rhodobacteraceae bacterium]|nr:hypothetical protein [Paracoccaceae bacterium]
MYFNSHTDGVGMMMNKFVVIGLIGVLGMAGCTPVVPTMTLIEAETYCGPQAERYARRPIPVVIGGTIQVGLQAEYPDDFMVQDYYKRCVYAHSGQRASGRLEWRL